MAKPTGFLEYKRKSESYRPVSERVKDFNEVFIPLTPDEINKQAARCMDCGVPFCHGYGCPVGNRIPEFNDYVYQGRWEEACKVLHSTNNFPEMTGRVCPAPCETACTLGLHDDPVTIRHIEFQIVEKGWENGWVKPILPKKMSGKSVAVIGSGPAGLAAAQQLARAGHRVVVFEKSESVGGLLRYGIPDFKLDKGVIDRRVKQMEAEGVDFQTGTKVGEDISVSFIKKRFDAICITMGAGVPRNLTVPGRGLEGVHFALDYLGQQNKIVSGESLDGHKLINAKDKVVVVIGGGDTGSDCVGTANRQGAKDIYQFEILPKPSESRPANTPWPMWPAIMRSSSSHQEGCERRWSVLTKKLTGSGINVEKLCGVEVDWSKDRDGNWKMSEKAGTEFAIKADLVLLAMGFVHVDHTGIIEELDLKIDERGNVTLDDFMSSSEGVFAAGDTVSGASLVVRAIDSGRKMAEAVDKWLRK